MRLSKRYLEALEVQVLTVDLTLLELSAKLAREGRPGEIHQAVSAVDAASEVVPISPAAAEAAGPLLIELRHRERNASLADAGILATARSAGATLVSGDACFRGQRDVIAA